MPWIAEDLGSR